MRPHRPGGWIVAMSLLFATGCVSDVTHERVAADLVGHRLQLLQEGVVYEDGGLFGGSHLELVALERARWQSEHGPISVEKYRALLREQSDVVALLPAGTVLTVSHVGRTYSFKHAVVWQLESRGLVPDRPDDDVSIGEQFFHVPTYSGDTLRINEAIFARLD